MVTNRRIGFRGLPRISHSRFQIREFRSPPAGMRPARAREARCCTTRPRAYRSHTKTKRAEQRSALPVRRNRAAHDLKGGQPRECIRTEQGSVLQCRTEAVRLNRPGRYSNSNVPTRKAAGSSPVRRTKTALGIRGLFFLFLYSPIASASFCCASFLFLSNVWL